MSFSAKIPIAAGFGRRPSLKWAGANLDTLSAQRRSLLSARICA
ncbi:hypothetical protein LT85_4562 [Collimonas arenae]|uniref:Uncharacterized protein n=2 Tax=Collimonas arenae TaxID=279058 RepID=A0A0A1FJ38_9BURK|nr:hypothetical protein LT85_4562 [Collimonas arenae]